MRKWKQGVITLLVFFVGLPFVTITGNYVVGLLASFAVIISAFYAFVLVIVFVFQQLHRWSREKSELKIEEKVVRTKIMTTYECGHCRSQYTDSLTCPKCGSPYRRTVAEKTEEETVEKWK